MAAVMMYASGTCPYCTLVERLLNSKGITEFTKIRVDFEPAKRTEMMARTGPRTVPQIYIGGTHVGGYDELAALDQAGGLDALLRAGFPHKSSQELP